MNFQSSENCRHFGSRLSLRRMNPSLCCDASGGKPFRLDREEIAHFEKKRERQCRIDMLPQTVADPANRIYVHAIPFFGDLRPEAIKQRKKWLNFVKTKRAHWQDTKHSVVCSEHFKREDYIHCYPKLPGLDKARVPKLKKDESGVIVFPTVHSTATASKSTGESQPLSSRTMRKV